MANSVLFLIKYVTFLWLSLFFKSDMCSVGVVYEQKPQFIMKPYFLHSARYNIKSTNQLIAPVYSLVASLKRSSLFFMIRLSGFGGSMWFCSPWLVGVSFEWSRRVLYFTSCATGESFCEEQGRLFAFETALPCPFLCLCLCLRGPGLMLSFPSGASLCTCGLLTHKHSQTPPPPPRACTPGSSCGLEWSAWLSNARRPDLGA